MRRELGQLTWRTAGRQRRGAQPAAGADRGAGHWAAFERLLGEVYAAPVGRPSYGPVVLLQCLLLQQWYRLSDPGLEEALSDRLSFRRRRAGAARPGARPLDPVAPSQRAGPAGTGGAAAGGAQPPARRLGADGQGRHPDQHLPGQRRCRRRAGRAGRGPQRPRRQLERDPEQPLFGDKMHLAADQGSGLVRRAILPPATYRTRIQSWLLVQGDEQAVLAQQVYDGWW